MTEQQIEQLKLVDELRRNPGEWRYVKTHKTYTACKTQVQTIRRGLTRAWRPAGTFDAKWDSWNRVYARYVGEEQS